MFPDFVYRDNVGMIERGGRLGFALEPVLGLFVGRGFLGQELEGDLAIQLGIVGEKYLPHPAFAELFQNLVA